MRSIAPGLGRSAGELGVESLVLTYVFGIDCHGAPTWGAVDVYQSCVFMAGVYVLNEEGRPPTPGETSLCSSKAFGLWLGDRRAGPSAGTPKPQSSNPTPTRPGRLLVSLRSRNSKPQ